MDEVRRHWLSFLPDLPIWVETRSMLGCTDAQLLEHPDRTGCVVWRPQMLASVVGEPDPQAVAHAAAAVPELLAFADNVERVRALLPEFQVEAATIFSAPAVWPEVPPWPCRRIGPEEIAAQSHLPAELHAELTLAGNDDVTMVAAFDDGRPVAFAYAASETESLWDMSIDTLPGHRRRGCAAAAAVHLAGLMQARGKTGVWGALASNHASANLARKLGYLACDRLWLLTRRVVD